MKILLGVLISVMLIIPVSAANLMDQLEIEIGKSVDSSIRKDYKVLNNPTLTAYISRLGMEMVNNSTRKKLHYTFTVLDADNTINAFAGPGGYIYITTGLLKFCDNNAEVCGVLAHEVAHVAHHDQMDALGLNVGLMALATLATGSSPEMVQAGVDVSLGLIQNGYSRSDEKQADLSAVDYMVGAQMNPSAMWTLFEKMKAKMGDVKGIEVYFSSHPSTEQRISDIKSKVFKMDVKKVGDLPFYEEEFKTNILAQLGKKK